MKNLFLHEFHQKHNANFEEIASWQLPADYGSKEDELKAAHHSVALADRSFLCKLKMKGKDSIDLLNRITTNDMSKLLMGSMCDTVFTSPKGRIVDFCRVLPVEDEYLIISSYPQCDHLLEWIDRFVILEDVTVENVSDRYVWLSAVGPRSHHFLNHLGVPEVSEREDQFWAGYDSIHFPVMAQRRMFTRAFDMCLTTDEAEQLMPWIDRGLNEEKGQWLGANAFEIVRVESGMPGYNSELSEDYNPHEARLIDAVSFTKGCYTGQEVIARLDTFDKVQKHLMLLEFEAASDFSQTLPSKIYYEDEKIGILTSLSYHPIKGKYIGMGYIRKMYTAAPGKINAEVATGDRRLKATVKFPPNIQR